jgi:hypothetical protein
LIRKFCLFSRANHPLHQARVRDHAGILYFDARTLAKSHFHFQGVWRIAHRRDVNRNTDVRIDAIS